MSASSADKGKARAIDPRVDVGHEQPSLRLVQPQSIPSTTLLNVEYPGILSDDISDSASSSSPLSYTSLERALSTLHPSALPPLTSSPHEALNFLAKIPSEGLRVVECRLGSFASPIYSAAVQPLSDPSGSGSDHANIDQVYRAPLIGEAVPTHNIIVRVVKRTWRQKRKRRGDASAASTLQDHDPANIDDMTLDPALFSEADPNHAEPSHQANGDEDRKSKRTRYNGRIKKEYCVQVLGMATNAVRFRGMADFSFQPNVTSRTSEAASHLDPVMALHRALATMDLEAFQKFHVPEQLEDYQISDPDASPDIHLRSNLHMVPPAFFSRMDVPFNYGFQHMPYSELRTIPTSTHRTKPPTSASFAHALKRDDLLLGQTQRFVNRVRLSNITPQPFRVGRDAKVPTRPLPDVLRIEHRCEPKVLARLRDLLLERPVWSRVALKNHLSDSELRELHGNNEKVYYALVAYSMIGGPWRDTIVRFGYDVRKDQSSRIYQRIFLRGGPLHREPRLHGQAFEQRDVVEDVAVEDGEGEEISAARSSVVSLPSTSGSERATNTHLFDGTSLHRHVGNFQLCDIEDPLIKPFIWRPNDQELPRQSVLPSDQPPLQPMGTEWLRSTYDAETGWYSRRALELIRALLTARFKSLVDTAKPLERDAVDAIVARIRLKWHEEDQASLENNGIPQHGEIVQVEQTQPELAKDDDDDDNSAIDPSLM